MNNAVQKCFCLSRGFRGVTGGVTHARAQIPALFRTGAAFDLVFIIWVGVTESAVSSLQSPCCLPPGSESSVMLWPHWRQQLEQSRLLNLAFFFWSCFQVGSVKKNTLDLQKGLIEEQQQDLVKCGSQNSENLDWKYKIYTHKCVYSCVWWQLKIILHEEWMNEVKAHTSTTRCFNKTL